jgi:hypothetical protein
MNNTTFLHRTFSYNNFITPAIQKATKNTSSSCADECACADGDIF